MEKTVREIIKETSRDHIKKNNSLIFGQCLSAVGWVGGTVPELTEKEGLLNYQWQMCERRHSCWSRIIK